MYTEDNLEALEPDYQERIRRVQRDREQYRRKLALINTQLKQSLSAAERQAVRKRWSNVMLAIRACNEIIGDIFASYAKRKAMERREANRREGRED